MGRQFAIRAEIVPALLFAVVPLLLLAGITLFEVLGNIPAVQRAEVATTHAVQIVRVVSRLNDAIQDAERGQRGFIITGREEYLKPYDEGRAALPQLVQTLLEATQGQPAQQRHILELQSHLTTKLNELSTSIEARRTGGFDAALAIVNSNLGRESMEAIQADLTAISEESDRRLRERFEASNDVAQRVQVTFIISAIVAAVSLLFGATLLARAYGRAAQSERVLQATLDSIREGVSAFDRDGRLLAWNGIFARTFGLAPETLRQGAPLLSDSGTPDELTKVKDQIRELDARARRTGLPALVEEKRADGRTIELFHSPTVDGGYVTTFLDVTEQRLSAEALRQSQKLESIGQMTGGVAHDFNNLLTIIIGSLGLLRRAVLDNEKALQRVEMVNIAAERGARLTKQLLAFARRQPLQPETVNVGQLMTETLPLIRRAVGEPIVVECVSAGGLWNAVIDASQFQSALLNLAINARDAMPDGGKLTIEVANAALDDIYAARHADVEPGQYVLCAVTDTGKGMDAETAAKALDPFFTTKPVGQGTGLGLPQVYGFVKQSGGHLKIYSEVGEGTTIKMYLPRALGDASPLPRPGPAQVLTGSETVLLVDDDEIVRATVASMLEDLGYNVLSVASASQAIAILETGTPVDLLFTDVVMPGPMGGRQLAEQARKLRPDLNVLFTSGYTENAIVHHGRLDPGVHLLSKPYDRERLASKVRRVLDSGRDGSGEAAS